MNKDITCFFLLAFFLTVGLTGSLFAQAPDKCALPAYRHLQQLRNPQLAGEAAFERWVQQKLERKSRGTAPFRQQKEVVQLPVVVHVVHNGEALGIGSNIPESQILRQIEILNQDFRKLNQAQIEALPADFRAVAADTEIEFVLARQDPEGLSSNGITRTQGPLDQYSYETNDFELKNLIHWPAEEYINIYVAPLASPYIGYAQFPETDLVQGLDKGLTTAQTDGVVIDYRYLGEGGNAIDTSRGRTATHELGHYFGLLHTWGDGGCEADDYVEDTPLSSQSYNGFGDCSSTTQESCGSPDMFQNFLAYTNDACMSLFTEGQKERMLIILQNSPRRRELPTSRAKEEPTVVANDAGLRQFVLGLTDSCSKTFIPQLTIRNYGSNQLTQAEVSLFIQGELFTKRTVSLNLAYLETEIIQLEEIDYALTGLVGIEARITSTNGTTDGKAFNNSLLAELYIPEQRETPFFEDFEGSSYPFYRINPDYLLTWQQVQAPISGNPNNLAMAINYYDYEISQGSKDYLISPVFDLSQESQSYLSFNVAYALYSRNVTDKLDIYVTTDCSETIENATLIYSKSGEALASAPISTKPFVPASNDDWRNEFLDLSAFAGSSTVQLLFVGTNHFGNNLYLDDIEVIKESPYEQDVTLRSINNPSVVSCEADPMPGILIRNTGRNPLQSIDVFYATDGDSERRVTLSDLSIAPMASQQINLPRLQLSPGEHLLQVRVANPNGQPDENPSNNALAKNFVIDQQQDIIPLRQQFTSQNLIRTSWTSANPNPELSGWEIRPVPGPVPGTNYAAASEFFESERGAENWLVSPVLDFSEVQEAGMQFRYSYAPILNASDVLQVRVSTDCGISWNQIVFEKKGSELSAKTVNSRWSPRNISDWNTAFTNLSAFAGNPQVRIAFVAISDGGNNIYLDDIEFFESGNPLTAIIPEANSLTAYPNPTNSELNVVFNLTEKEDVQLQLFSIKGELMYRSSFSNTLNQIYTIDMSSWQAGVYILKTSSPSLHTTQRILLFK